MLQVYWGEVSQFASNKFNDILDLYTAVKLLKKEPMKVLTIVVVALTILTFAGNAYANIYL